MYTRHIKYIDFNGNPVEGDFMFNMTRAELLKMQLSTNGGWEAYIKQLMATNDQAQIMEIFDKLLCNSYGIRSADGISFIKVKDGHALAEDFKQTAAYDELFTELVTNLDVAAEFFKHVVPKVDDNGKLIAPAN